MTVRPSPAAALDEIIRQARHLLFAFDGPIRSAVTGNPPAPYIHDVLTAWRESGGSAVVVSTRPGGEVHAYLDAHDLSTQVTIVAASIAQALSDLDATLADCVVVARTTSDIESARSAGVASIAYARNHDDAEHQTATGATAVVYSLADIALKLRSQPAVTSVIYGICSATFARTAMKT